MVRWMVAGLCLAALLGCGGGGGGGGSDAAEGSGSPTPPPAQAGALSGRFVVGYQGWYGCPGDYDGNTTWQHWFVGPPAAANLVVDMLPATDALAPQDLCETGLVRRDGTPLRLFSSQNRNVVDYHFRLMAEQGVGAVALQRFVVELGDERRRRRLDNVLQHVAGAAARHGVPFFISYDVTGADAATVVQTIRDDWAYVTGTLGITGRGGYLRHAGTPLLQLWGFGFTHTPGTPAEVRDLIGHLQRGGAGRPPVLLVGGVPVDWRTLDGHSKPDPAWLDVYLAYDVISPWTVGRYVNEADALNHYTVVAVPDAARARAAGAGYLPVIFPGFSWFNLMKLRGTVDPGLLNVIPRDCGRFFLRQAALAAEHRMDAVYGAMFDEFDEGTALLPSAPSMDAFPLDAAGVSLDQDGCSLPADWYVRLAGRVALGLRHGTAPTMP